MYVFVQAHSVPEGTKGVRGPVPPGTGLVGSCDLLEVGAGNQTWVLC